MFRLLEIVGLWRDTVVVLLFFNLSMPRKESHLRKHICQIACRQFYRLFSRLTIDVEGPAHLRQCYSVQEGPGLYKSED